MGSVPGSVYGAIMPISDAYRVAYKGHYGMASVLPTADTPPWTKTAVGSPTEAAAYGVLHLTCSPGNLARYSIADALLSNEDGAVVEFRARIPSSSSSADSGLLLEICDGECQFVAFLRADGYNIFEQPAVARDLTGWHTYRIATHHIDCLLSIDGELVQLGHATALTTAQRVGFGCAIGYGYAEAYIDRCMERGFYIGGTAPQEGYIMTIGPTALSIPSLPAASDGSSWVTAEVDHSSNAVFTCAEPPIFTDPSGDSLEDQGLHVEFLCDTNGSGFRVKVTNYSYVPYGYPTISLLWTRRGFVEV